MAIQLNKTLYNGTVVNYHMISGYILNRDKKEATAIVESYCSEVHRAHNNLPELKEKYTFTWDGDTGTLSESAYKHLLSLDEWKDGVFV